MWSRSMSVALSIKNKLRFVDGTYLAPSATDASHSAWIRCNFVVLNWIFNSVSEDIAQSLISYDDAASVWKDLKQRFSQEYFTNLKVLWEEFLQYRPIPICDCNPDHVVACKVVTKMLLYQDQDYVIRFIRGLNESFEVVRSQLLLMEPLPDINTAFKFAVQLERQMKVLILELWIPLLLLPPLVTMGRERDHMAKVSSVDIVRKRTITSKIVLS
ncbi:hypothetical protein LINGRAPRIM_LOCUS670 [Linum grandiflorum]